MWVGRRLGFRLRPKRRREIDQLGGDGVEVLVVVLQVRVLGMEVKVVLEDVELGGLVDVVVVVVVVVVVAAAVVAVLDQSKKKQNL